MPSETTCPPDFGEMRSFKTSAQSCGHLQRVFGISDHDAGLVFGAVRSGLFHDAMTKAGVGIVPEVPVALVATAEGKILLRSNLVIAAVAADFDRYILELNREGTDLRVDFERPGSGSRPRKATPCDLTAERVMSARALPSGAVPTAAVADGRVGTDPRLVEGAQSIAGKIQETERDRRRAQKKT